mmetsp:Transcript_5281/g.9702  ORF Transcript_5281/g.9702 Transcript_5281/m.9702 type:complete len:476 (+) Transcript_5281:78-1505(+)
MMFSGAFQLFVAVLAASKAESFSPANPLVSVSNRKASTVYYRNNEATSTDTDSIANALDMAQLPPISCSISTFETESLDAEMDSFADPNDKRYSASDWKHNIVSLPNSSIAREIKGPVGWITAWSTLVSIVYKICNARGLNHITNSMCLGTTPHSLIASSVGLLLVFRTNSAYQRFTEGRKTWEQLLNTCRDVTRMLSVYEREVGSKRKQRIQRLLAAFPYLLHQHIQPRCLDHSQCEELKDTPHALLLNEPRSVPVGCIKTKMKTRKCWVDKRSLPWCLLPGSVLNKCAQSHNRPLWVSDRLALEITDIEYCNNWTSRERLDLLKCVSKLTECIGHCERIHQTAVPLNYARHALRSLTLWSFTLPFGLVDKLGLLTGPTMAVVSWLMFGVYQIGHTIEDPFQGSLRLTDMCNSIYRDVMYGDRNRAGMRRESAFRRDGESDKDWDSLGDAFGVGWTVQANDDSGILEEEMEPYQ